MPEAYTQNDYALTVPQIAEVMGITEKEVKAALERARYKLRTKLQRRGLVDQNGRWRDE